MPSRAAPQANLTPINTQTVRAGCKQFTVLWAMLTCKAVKSLCVLPVAGEAQRVPLRGLLQASPAPCFTCRRSVQEMRTPST